jgi:hypothetical protein
MAMVDDLRNNAGITRERPFPKGNPGRPKGARHKATAAAEALLAGEAEALTRRCIEAALGGDMVAIRICRDRLVPVRKERTVVLDLPPVETRCDAAKATTALLRAVAYAEIAPGEATELVKLIVAHVSALDDAESASSFASLFPGLDLLQWGK